MKKNKKEEMRLIFLGPPGSGKGTQAQLISKNFGIPHISTGDIFRNIIKTNKPKKLADIVNKYVKEGLLVPDDIVFECVKTALKNNKSFILDGYPRNLNQAELLDKYFGNNGINKVIYFKVTDKEIIKRLSSRRVCPKCGKVYNIYTLKPKKDNICDICGIKLIIREDDKVSTIKKRLKVYKKETLPLIDYYKKKNLLLEVKANDTVENIYNNIVSNIIK